MVNFIQKLQTESLLTINKKSQELTEDLKWPCNNTRYIYWPEQSLNFRIEDNKIIVDSELKRKLLELWTHEEWRKENISYQLENIPKIKSDSPYFFGNPLHLNVELLGKLYVKVLERANLKLQQELDGKPWKEQEEEDKQENFNLLEIADSELHEVINVHQNALKSLLDSSNKSLYACPICYVKTQFGESNMIFEGYPEEKLYRSENWNDLEFYIYQNLNHTDYVCYPSMVYNRCWLCDMSRVTWHLPEIQKQLRKSQELNQKKIEKNNNNLCNFNNQTMVGDICGTLTYGYEDEPCYDSFLDTSPNSL